MPVNDKITVFGYRAAVAVIDKDSTRAQIFLIKSALDVIVVICRLDHGIADLCTVYLNKPVSVVILFSELVQISKLALKFGASGICSVISRCFPVMVSAGIVYLTGIVGKRHPGRYRQHGIYEKPVSRSLSRVFKAA